MGCSRVYAIWSTLKRLFKCVKLSNIVMRPFSFSLPTLDKLCVGAILSSVGLQRQDDELPCPPPTHTHDVNRTGLFLQSYTIALNSGGFILFSIMVIMALIIVKKTFVLITSVTIEHANRVTSRLLLNIRILVVRVCLILFRP